MAARRAAVNFPGVADRRGTSRPPPAGFRSVGHRFGRADLPPRVIVPARRWRRGHGPGANTRDAGRRGNPGVGQVRAGSDPRGAPRHRPGACPGRCRLSRRGVSDVPVLRLPVSGLGRGARTPCPQPPEPASAPWPSSRPPPRSGRVRRSLRVGPEAGRRGGISSIPPGKLPPGLTPASEPRPAPVRRPGRWRLKATDAGAAPPPDPPGQPPGGPPKDAPGSLPGRRGQVRSGSTK